MILEKILCNLLVGYIFTLIKRGDGWGFPEAAIEHFRVFQLVHVLNQNVLG